MRVSKCEGDEMVIIRNATVEEQVTIKELRYNAYKEHAQKLEQDHWNVLKNQILSNADLRDDVERIVAEIDGEIVGTVAVFPPKTDAYSGLVEELNHPEIRMLAVATNHRGKGIATALIEACIQRVKRQGYEYIGLHTADFMESAIKLYDRLGFERLPHYDFVPSDDGIVVKAFRYKIK